MSSWWNSLRTKIESRADAMPESEFAAWKFGLIVAGILLVVGIGAFLTRPLWKPWRRDSLIEQAHAFEEKKDYRNALLSLRKATETLPNDVTAWREAARILSDVGSADALVAEEQLVRLQPQDISLRLSLVKEALRFQKLDTARDALAAMSAGSQSDAAFHRLAAALAEMSGDKTELLKHLSALVALKPDDIELRFNYAAVRLWGSDEKAAEAARKDLYELTKDPLVRVRASLELLKDAARSNNQAHAISVMTRLVERFAPGKVADFSSPSMSGWNTLIKALQNAAATSASDCALLLQWMSDTGQRRPAIIWYGSLPNAIQAETAVAAVAAQCYAETGDLDRLGSLLANKAWGEWPSTAITLALAAHIQILRQGPARGHDTWDDAIVACAGSATGLRALARLASIWHDTPGMETALQALIAASPRSYFAYDTLRTNYAARRDLSALWGLYDAWVKQKPDDNDLAATWITLGCILNRGTPEAYTRAVALPGPPQEQVPYAITQAAALWRQKKADAAWKVLSQLTDAQRLTPTVSYWSAIVLADLDRKSDANSALARARSREWSAEEQALLVAASAKINPPPRAPERPMTPRKADDRKADPKKSDAKKSDAKTSDDKNAGAPKADAPRPAASDPSKAPPPASDPGKK